MIYMLDNKPFWKNTTVPLDQAPDVTPYVPWFLDCNKQRFPYWFGHPDPRNHHLLAMRSGLGQRGGQDKGPLGTGSGRQGETNSSQLVYYLQLKVKVFSKLEYTK